jgi:DNA-binding transcriptional regulator YiaG
MINKCELCGGEYQTLKNQTIHASKLVAGNDNLYLENVTVEKCAKCGDTSPYFPTSDEFFVTIARAIVLQPYFLTGGEIKFLRKERGMKAKEFTALLHIDPATLSRWEDDKQARSPQNDALVRLIYVQLYTEQTGQPFPEKVLDKLTAAGPRPENFTIWIDTKSPMSYRYNKGEELAAAI